MVPCRRARAVADRAIQNDGVDLRPEHLQHFAQGIFLAEPIPPNALESVCGRKDRDLLDVTDRFALSNENVIAWVKEIF